MESTTNGSELVDNHDTTGPSSPSRSSELHGFPPTLPHVPDLGEAQAHVFGGLGWAGPTLHPGGMQADTHEPTTAPAMLLEALPDNVGYYTLANTSEAVVEPAPFPSLLDMHPFLLWNASTDTVPTIPGTNIPVDFEMADLRNYLSEAELASLAMFALSPTAAYNLAMRPFPIADTSPLPPASASAPSTPTAPATTAQSYIAPPASVPPQDWPQPVLPQHLFLPGQGHGQYGLHQFAAAPCTGWPDQPVNVSQPAVAANHDSAVPPAVPAAQPSQPRRTPATINEFGDASANGAFAMRPSKTLKRLLNPGACAKLKAVGDRKRVRSERKGRAKAGAEEKKKKKKKEKREKQREAADPEDEDKDMGDDVLASSSSFPEPSEDQDGGLGQSQSMSNAATAPSSSVSPASAACFSSPLSSSSSPASAVSFASASRAPPQPHTTAPEPPAAQVLAPALPVGRHATVCKRLRHPPKRSPGPLSDRQANARSEAHAQAQAQAQHHAQMQIRAHAQAQAQRTVQASMSSTAARTQSRILGWSDMPPLSCAQPRPRPPVTQTPVPIPHCGLRMPAQASLAQASQQMQHQQQQRLLQLRQQQHLLQQKMSQQQCQQYLRQLPHSQQILDQLTGLRNFVHQAAQAAQAARPSLSRPHAASHALQTTTHSAQQCIAGRTRAASRAAAARCAGSPKPPPPS